MMISSKKSMSWKCVLGYLDWPLIYLLRFLVERFSIGTLGALDAFRYDARLDTWERNNAVREFLLRHLPTQPGLVLDVGGNANELARVLPDRLRLVVVDLNRTLLSGTAVCADAACLPFKSGVFDAVVSVDMLEHVPARVRGSVVKQMLTVRKKGAPVILHFPCHDGGAFRGEEYDRQFLSRHKKLFDRGDCNTEEHLAHGLPGVAWLQQEFPEALVQGRQYGPGWVNYMLLERIPFVRLLMVFWYALRVRHTPPYHACLVEVP